MKRILYLFAFVLICSMAQAVDTTVQIKIKGASKPSVSTDAVYLIQADRYSAAKDTSDIAKLMNPDTQVSVWAISPVLGNLSTMQTNDLKGIYIGFHANANTNYTMTFDPNWLQGGTLYLKDWVKDTVFAMTASMSYPFSVATASTTYTTRFQIVGSFTPDPGNLEVCHIGNNLEVKNNPYIKSIVVKNEAGDKVIDVEPENTPQTISLADLPQGRYIVEFNDGKEVFVISVKPTMTLAPDTSFAASINKGEQFLFACTPRTDAGIYTETFKTAGGADSIVHLHLSYIPCDTAYAMMTQLLCPGDLPYTYKSFTIVGDTVIREVIEGGAASGCDSITTLTFTINRPVATTPENKTICDGDFYTWRGKNLSEAGQYMDTVRYAASGCDSAIYVLNLRVDAVVPVEPENKTICGGDFYDWRGKKLTKAGEYKDTVRYAASGCDSAVYVLNLRVDAVVPVEPENATICDGDFFDWRGKKLSVAGTYSDTIRYAESGCDSAIYVLNLRVDKLIPTTPENKSICEGSYYEWRGKKLSEAGVYIDTVRYAASGCDSAIYQITISVDEFEGVIPTDTIVCSGTKVLWRYKYYKAEGLYYDTVRYKSGCDSIIYSLTIKYYKDPEVPVLAQYISELPHVVCGMPIDAKNLQAAIDKAIAQSHKPSQAPVAESWLEVRLSPTDAFQRLSDDIIPHSQKTIDLRIAIKTECDNILYGLPVAFDVEIPSPENTPEMDNLPAVSKYDDWLLMIDKNYINEMGLYPDPEDVTWYRVVGTIDPIRTVGVDQVVGTGYYYTADKSLTGKYYAVITTGPEMCNAKFRTVVITCAAAQQMSLAPRKLRNGEAMTLSHLDANQPTEISIYATDGRMLHHTTLNGVESYDFQPADGEGIYLMRAVNGEQSETFKYIVTK